MVIVILMLAIMIFKVKYLFNQWLKVI